MRTSRSIRFLVPALCVLAGLSGGNALGAVKPHLLFTEGVVLQQGMKVPVWGSAEEGEKVTVRFQKQEVSTTTEKDGRWSVELEGLKPGGPFTMTIAGKNTITLKNVLVGEVWLCGGEANMELALSGTEDATKVINLSQNSMLRLFTVGKSPRLHPQQDLASGLWADCGPTTVPGFSAVAYYFGSELQKTLDVPVGLIQVTWINTQAHSWTARHALAAYPVLREIIDAYDYQLDLYYNRYVPDHLKAIEAYVPLAKKARSSRQELPPFPYPPTNPGNIYYNPTTLYNGMIAPLMPYAIKGVIWYQGESDTQLGHRYRTLFPAMIKNWRSDWNQGDFPFLFVQLAPYQALNPTPHESYWAELREAQLMTEQQLTPIKVANTAMAVTIDCGEETTLYPRRKNPVGHRLALAARTLAYSQKVTYSGPVYESMKVKGSKAVLTFKKVGKGLEAMNGPLKGFTIAGNDRKFYPAEAVIQEDTVIVSSAKVSVPRAVRYGWANYPDVNLWNRDGLPASPFRTDDYPILSGPKK